MLIPAWKVESNSGRETAYFLDEEAANTQREIKDVKAITFGEHEIKESDIIELNRYRYLVL